MGRGITDTRRQRSGGRKEGGNLSAWQRRGISRLAVDPPHLCPYGDAY